MHVADTEKGKPIAIKSEKEVLDIANTIIQENGLEDYADVIKRGALLANVSTQRPLDTPHRVFSTNELHHRILTTGRIARILLQKRRKYCDVK